LITIEDHLDNDLNGLFFFLRSSKSLSQQPQMVVIYKF